MTPAQRRWYRKLKADAFKAADKSDKFRQRMAKDCTHDEEFCEPWQGQMRGKTHTYGTYCTICRCWRPSMSAHWWAIQMDAYQVYVDACPHPAEMVEEYRWHHGYGKYVTGVQCMVCYAKKPFPTQGYWWSKKAQDEQDANPRDWRDD